VNGRPAEALVDATLAWLEDWRAREPRRPFFLFVNFFDAHYPYTAPAVWARRFLPPDTLLDSTDRSQFDALYDAEIRYADEHLGRLLDWLREQGLYDETLVVVTADHGEMMGEHEEWGHNGLLFEPLVRIPLVVKQPGQREGRVDEVPIQHPGIFDRVLRTAGLAPPESPRPLLAEVFHPEPGTGRWKVLWEGDLKYMQHSGGDDRLYDLAGDRRERVNRVDDRPDDARRLRERLAAEIAALPAPPRPSGEAPVQVDAATRRALERLGYLDPAEEPAQPPTDPAPSAP
jgi:arylsulfatase A-like enzyme